MGAARILLIGRVRPQQSSLIAALQKRYEVVVTPSGKQALSLAQKQPPQVVVLDAISLRTPGDRICQDLRRWLEFPIVHLHPGPRESAASPADIILFEPFTSRKLINSIERLLPLADDDGIITCGPFWMDVSRRVLVANGQETQLTPKLAVLVEMFLNHPGETLDRKTLMVKVWDTDYLGDTRTLDVHVRWIRQAIEPEPGKPRYLKTIRGVGYRLDVPDLFEPDLMDEEIVSLETL
jgi:DNA-binding response OmpR family regulator